MKIETKFNIEDNVWLLVDHKPVCGTVENIEIEARKNNIAVKTLFQIGRFGIICVDIVKKENPAVIITTRSRRPDWIKKIFGSPVSYLIEHSACPVIEL